MPTSSTSRKKVTQSQNKNQADLNALTCWVLNQSSNVIRCRTTKCLIEEWRTPNPDCLVNPRERKAPTINSNSDFSFQMDSKKRIAYICTNNKMRSTVIRNVCVLCTYLICPSMEKYKLFCEMGIAIAVTLIETIIDQMSSKHIEPFAIG